MCVCVTNKHKQIDFSPHKLIFYTLEYVKALNKHVESRYSADLFEKFPLPSGVELNISLNEDLIKRWVEL